MPATNYSANDVHQIIEYLKTEFLPIYLLRVIPTVWYIKAHKLPNPIFREKCTSVEGVRERCIEENICS